MGLKELAEQALKDFDRQHGSLNSNDGLPSGTYDCVVNGAEFHAYTSGYECISLDLKVVVGDHLDQHEFINILLDPDYVTKKGEKFGETLFFERNIKTIAKFAALTHVTLTDEDWEDQVTLGRALEDARGQQIVLKVTKSTSKQGRTFTNYDFEGYEEPELNDEDLPF